MKKRRKTAAELTAELERDPEYVARRRRQDEASRRHAEEYGKAAAPLLAELEAAAFDVPTVGALRRQGRGYRRAIPILLRWLPRVTHPGLKEDIVRALSVPFAKPAAAPALVAEFRRTDAGQESLRWAIGNALEVLANDSVYADVVEIVQDRNNGKSREMFTVALGNMKEPRAVDVLVGLLGDDEVAGHAIVGLRKLGARRARGEIERFLNHPKSWIRNEARRAIKKIDNVSRRNG